ncbi:tail fiber assembly protein [Citrobacter koseri]|uniref:tail fiber assembly protein n=1 Tax=Citrobacter koseri TaxID=545 RepID=UPI00397C2ADF
MAIFFSASTCGFYDDQMKENYIDAGSWPDDTVPVSERWYEYLIQKQSEGKIIIANEYGSPVISDPAPLSTEQLVQEAGEKKAELLAMADAAIALLSRAVRLKMATDEEVGKLEEWERYSVLLNRVETSTAPDIDWPPQPE